jgi:hypothetical protein
VEIGINAYRIWRHKEKAAVVEHTPSTGRQGEKYPFF